MAKATSRRTKEQIEEDIRTHTKLCTYCNERKSMDDFHKVYGSKNSPDGRSYKCITCDLKAHAEWRKKNRGKASLRDRKSLVSSYGITLEDYDKMLSDQGGVCKICGGSNSESARKNSLYIDHDHVTGVVRGLLCDRCNRGLGMFLDDPTRLLQAVSYLTKEGDMNGKA